ncbi:hypothetical protein [Streptomyces sp. NPDC057460]|uniref:hypothetical protein n=1 Tax=Streptomyces sp. NPDC057460 TaxID=3346141 RepID=UPI00367CAA35
MAAYVPNELLSRLVGCRLDAVHFILDHLELHFGSPDEQILTYFVMPCVETPDGEVYRDGRLGYADALRALAGEEVVETAEATGIGLRIRLPSGTVVLHPEWDELVGPEIASYRTRGFADWTVWRPGEDSFEDLA